MKGRFSNKDGGVAGGAGAGRRRKPGNCMSSGMTLITYTWSAKNKQGLGKVSALNYYLPLSPLATCIRTLSYINPHSLQTHAVSGVNPAPISQSLCGTHVFLSNVCRLFALFGQILSFSCSAVGAHVRACLPRLWPYFAKR